MKKKLIYATLLVCELFLLSLNAQAIENGIYTVDGGHKTVIRHDDTRGSIYLIVASGNLNGNYYWGFNQNTNNSTFDDYSNPGTGTYMSGDGKMHGGTYGSENNNARGGSGDTYENGFTPNPINFNERQGPCPDGRHVPSRGERNALVIARCNLDDECHARYSDTQIGGVTGDLRKMTGTYEWTPDNKLIWINRSGLGPRFMSTFNMTDGYYWSSSPYPIVSNAWELGLGDYGVRPNIDGGRNSGTRVRCFQNPVVVPVTFNKNGGDSVTIGSIKVVSGNTINLLEYTGTKAEWKFVGWNTDSGATGAMTNPTVTEPMTLYAIFKKDLTVTYLSGAGVASIEEDSGSCTMYNTGTSCTVVAPNVTLKPGYGTGIWSTGAIEVNPGETITLTADDTYTASATPNTDTQYLVEYYQEDLNGGYKLYETWTGHGTTDTQAVATGTDKSYSGFIFSGTHASNVTSGNIDGDGSRELKLYYDRMEYTVIFDSNSGSTVNPITAKYQSGITLPEPTRTGYTFKGWGDSFLSGEYTVTGNTTLTGQWGANTYTVHFVRSPNVNDTQTMEDQIFIYNQEQPLNENTFHNGRCTFSGWVDENGTTYSDKQNVINLATSGTITLTATWRCGNGGGGGGGGLLYTITWKNGDAILKTGTVSSGATPVYNGDIPTKAEDSSCTYTFDKWTPEIIAASGDATYTAIFICNSKSSSGGSSSGGGGGGGGGGSSKTNTKTTTGDVKTTTGDITTTGDTTKTPENFTSVDTTQQNSQNDSKANQNNTTQGKTYSEEFQKAYTFAHENKITTMNTIEKADMDKPLTRIAMAKMLSYYAINVLNKEPDTNRKIKFRDVSEKLDAQYDHGVTLAYQLGIMGINMKNNKFRPNDYVTRAEFGTALSRMLYGLADGKKKYYSTHLQQLMEKKIITNDDPNLRELRGYVMIMLMRSAENR